MNVIGSVGAPDALASFGVLPSPAALPSPALARRLADLCGNERNVQVDFLLHLGEFDARRDWAAAGFGSLWVYCLEVLHLREGAAWRRIEAMKLLRRFPALETPLRDGRLCLTTAIQLGPVLNPENVEELVARAAFLSKVDTERLVVSLRPRAAPADGIRRVAAPAASSSAPPESSPPLAPPPPPSPSEPIATPMLALSSANDVPSPARRPELWPVSAETYSLRVTLDAAAKAELDELVALLSHKTGGDLCAVVREAIRCAIAKHAKRKGAAGPERPRGGTSNPSPPKSARSIPMAVKRAVHERDGGRCAWTSPGGKRCGSRWRLEFGHLVPVALGGRSTVDNVRLECGSHNQHEAIRVFGPAHMAPFLRRHFLQRK